MIDNMVLKHALTTEKAVAGIERQNTLVFVVEESATKEQIRKKVEDDYREKIRSMRTLNAFNGKKKAFVSFVRKGAAADLAAKLKVI